MILGFLDDNFYDVRFHCSCVPAMFIIAQSTFDVTFYILHGSVILERNETRIVPNEMPHVSRETCLVSRETILDYLLHKTTF